MIREIAWVLAAIVIVFLSIFFIDEPLASWVAMQKLNEIDFFQFAVYLPNAIIYVATAATVVVLSTRQIQSLSKAHAAILALSMSGYLAVVATRLLKFFFGRIGPEHWVKQNFDAAATGFHWLMGMGTLYQSFPSGHSAAIVATSVVLASMYPGYRWLCFLASAIVLLSLIAIQSHYLSDCIAGGLIGFLLAVRTVRFFEAPANT